MSNLKFFLPSAIDLISQSEILANWEKKWDFWPLSEMKKTLDQGRSRLFFAEENGELVGAAFWAFVDLDAELLYVYVSEEHRGRNLGLEILSFSIDWLKEFGVKSLFLEVRPTNKSALAVYQKLGFIEVNRRKRYYPDGEDCLVMGKENI